MTFDSVYEMFNPLTSVRKQHFWDWFSGRTLNMGTDGRWAYTDRIGNHTGSGMVDEADGGFKLQGDTSTNQTLISFDDIKPFSNTGSVVIWVAKMPTVGTNYQGGWGMCGVMPSYWLNGVKVNVPQNDYCGFYTMDGSTEGGTSMDNITNCTSWRSYKMEQLSSSARCSVNGVLETSRTANMSTTAMQPFMYSKFANSPTYANYCEAYNT
jgi:hypothetical protein|tara:strand:+ start:2136 stop:2765 length:630 start_codon:yes stop_codon:yes gene_type:complete